MNSCSETARPRTSGWFARRALLICASLLFCNPSLAEQPRTPGLPDLHELAKRHDAAYLAAQSRFQADLENEKQALAALLPNLHLNARIERQDNQFEIRGQSIQTDRTPGTYSVVLNQPLFRPQAWVSFQQSQLGSQMARLRIEQAGQDLILRLARAYFDLLAAQDELKQLQSLKAAIEEQLAFAKASFDVGNATITDQQEAQARFDSVMAELLAAENRQAVQQLVLETLVGAPVGELAGLAPEVQLEPPSPANPDAWVRQAQEHNLQTLQARLSEQVARQELEKARLGHWPTLDLTAQVVDTEQQVFDGSSGRPFELGVSNTTVGVVMNLPLFAGGGTTSKARQQAALLEESRNRLNQATRQATLAAKTAFLGVQSSLSQVRALKAAVNSSKLSLQSSRTAYEVGIRIGLDVLNAQQQLDSVRRSLLKAQYASVIQMLELQAAAGQLDAASLAHINKLLVHSASNEKQ